jgi:hypothetical protein
LQNSSIAAAEFARASLSVRDNIAIEESSMSDEGHPARSSCGAIVLLLLLFVGCLPSVAQSQSGAGQDGTLVDTHSDKKVVQTGRWMIVRQFTVDFSVKCSDKTYCGEITTTVVNEVADIEASKGKPVALLASGKDIDVTLENGRRIKARQVASVKCTSQ